jgi:hypothetical protein
MAVGWRRPAAVESAVASLLGCYGSGTEMRKGRADGAEDLGDKDGGVALRFGVVDPLHRCGANLRGQERAALAEQGARAGASDACGALRTDLLSVWMVRCV